ncbi:MAG: hypothetical protein Q7Q71_08840 [Verrucomicrobiota bacterium JB023]|nr:hypothetical protein [Verrucomicrobiota bacterium JB023]
MGEMYDYFEDFPEENPANYVNGVYELGGAARVARATEEQEKANAELRAKLERVVAEARKKAPSEDLD